MFEDNLSVGGARRELPFGAGARAEDPGRVDGVVAGQTDLRGGEPVAFVALMNGRDLREAASEPPQQIGIRQQAGFDIASCFQQAVRG